MGIVTADGRVRRDPRRFLERLQNGKVRRRPKKHGTKQGHNIHCRCERCTSQRRTAKRAQLVDREALQQLQELHHPQPVESVLDLLDYGLVDGRPPKPRAVRRAQRKFEIEHGLRDWPTDWRVSGWDKRRHRALHYPLPPLPYRHWLYRVAKDEVLEIVTTPYQRSYPTVQEQMARELKAPRNSFRVHYATDLVLRREWPHPVHAGSVWRVVNSPNKRYKTHQIVLQQLRTEFGERVSTPVFWVLPLPRWGLIGYIEEQYWDATPLED